MPDLQRIEGQAEIPVEVVAVGPTGERSEPATLALQAFLPPTAAAAPSPADGATGVALGARLTWAPGTGAAERTLYFGTSPEPPAVGVLSGDPIFDPDLAANTTYYWRVEETNAAGTTPGPTWSFTTGSAPGTGAASLLFDGTDDRVDLGDGPGVNVTGTQITLEARLYPTAFQSQPYQGSVLNKEQNGPDNGYAMRVGGNGVVNFLLGANGWREVSSPSGTLVLNTWQHVALTYDGATQRIYVDGEEVASRNGAFSIAESAAPLYVGDSQRNPGRTFPGAIDEVRIWSVARSAEEIRETMATELPEAVYTSPESGLTGYWRFNEGSGQWVVDETGRANGTLGISAAPAADDPAWNEGAAVSAEDAPADAAVTALHPNYPNPFAHRTTVRFSLAAAGPVRLALYDVLGRQVAVLAEGDHAAGPHAVAVDAGGLASGVYLYRLDAPGFQATRRLVIAR